MYHTLLSYWHVLTLANKWPPMSTITFELSSCAQLAFTFQASSSESINPSLPVVYGEQPAVSTMCDFRRYVRAPKGTIGPKGLMAATPLRTLI